VVGGSSGIGHATADLLLQRGAEVWIASRDQTKLDCALQRFAQPDHAYAVRLDMTDPSTVQQAVAALPEDGINHLVISASSAVHGPFADMPVEAVQPMFESKFWGPYRVSQAMLAKLRAGGSITLFSGVLSQRPGKNCSALGAVNAAVEGLARGLALELGLGLRVNVISPGMVRTEAYARLPEDKRARMYAETGASLAVGRVGEAAEVAEAVLYAASNRYVTGQVIVVDGGHMIRQYA
jgi:NAD(P)-dependent dehydrogenase (short-subunit alcohol dehydrogenase family)